MAASAFAGTGVVKTTASGLFVKPGQRFKLNNGYSLTIKGNQTVLLHLNGVNISGPFTQSEMQRLWLDIATIGLNSP